MQITGTVTRKSNGTLEIQPSDPGTFNKLPGMADEVSLTIEVTRSATEIEQANAAAKRARIVDGATEATVGGAPLGEGEQLADGEGVSAPVARRVRK